MTEYSSSWTPDQVKEYVDALLAGQANENGARLEERSRRSEERDRRFSGRIAELDSRIAWRFDAQERAIGKAEAATERRFAAVNEFRAALGDATHRNMPRAEADVRFSTLQDELHRVDKRIEAITGKSAGTHASWGYLLGAVGMGGTLVAIMSRFV